MRMVFEKSTRDSLETLFQVAQGELLSLLHQHDELVARIEIVKQSLQALSQLFGEDFIRKDLLNRRVRDIMTSTRKRRNVGFTSAIRQVIKNSKQRLTTQEIHQYLLREFPECVEHHKTPISSITTVLKRLTISGELAESRNGKNLRVWEVRNGDKSLSAHMST